MLICQQPLPLLQNSLNQVNLKNLMMWHVMGKDLKCENVPVMDILKEFRELAGTHGRNAHKPSAPPQYDFKVKIKVDDSEPDAPAPAPAPAPA